MSKHTETWHIETVTGEEVELEIEFSFSPGCGPSWTSYGGDPGDPPEVEIERVYNVDAEVGEPWSGEVCLLPAEEEKATLYIFENPPDDDYDDYRDYED